MLATADTAIDFETARSLTFFLLHYQFGYEQFLDDFFGKMPSHSRSRGSLRNSGPRSAGSNSRQSRLRSVDVSAWSLRCFVLLLVSAVPWYFGCATWHGQYFLFAASIVLAFLIAVHCVVSAASKWGDCRVPWLTWLFFAFGLFAFAQSLPVFSWQGNGYAPPSVHLQKWALGITRAPNAIEKDILTKTAVSDNASSSNDLPCDLRNIPAGDQTLSISVEPLHTRAAFPSLLLCGMLVWVGRMVFSEPKKQLWLFGALTLIGVAIAFVGIQGAISHKAENFLGLKTGNSYATFVSKNSAGGYLNVCIAGCLGLLGWTLLNTQRTTNDVRYRIPDSTLLSRIRGAAEDLLADLNTPQIASTLCLVTIVSSLMISLCRGAVVSALAATVAAAVIANTKDKSRGSFTTVVAITAATVACLIGFQLDDQAYARIESLTEIDFEKEFRQGRAYIWSIAWKAAQFFGWCGSGLGTFHFAYLPFQEPLTPVWFYHAESVYAQCAVEMGFLGIASMIFALIAILIGIQRKIPTENWGASFPSKLAGSYLVISQALHSLVDFAIILPALFVPACLLIGSVQGALAMAAIPSAAKRATGRSSRSRSEFAPAQSQAWIRNGLMGILLSVSVGIGIYCALGSVLSLSLSESLVAKTKELDAVPLKDAVPLMNESPDRVRELASIWSSKEQNIANNPIAMRLIADGIIQDYQMSQFKLIDIPPGSTGATEWANTSPLLLHLVLTHLKNLKDQQQFDEAKKVTRKIVEQFSKEEDDEKAKEDYEKALGQLEKAADLYARGQAKSPLDWRLAFGRTFSNMTCTTEELAVLLPAVNQLTRHNSQLLLTNALIFGDQLESTQREDIRIQAMKSNPGSYMNVAMVIASEQKDGAISIDLFPQRYEVMQDLAKQVFQEDKFPKTYRLLWERSSNLIVKAPMGRFLKEVMLADASRALGDSDAELVHLREARKLEKNNVTIICRLASKYLDIAAVSDAESLRKDAETLWKEARGLAPADQKVKDLGQRIMTLLTVP